MSRFLALAVGLAALAVLPRHARGEDEEALVEGGPKFRIYGFGDIDYSLPLTSGGIAGNHGAMYVGNLNVYLDGQLTSRLRTLAEVRFSYHPSTDSNSTSTQDYTTMGSVSWGGVIIERAWAEYAFSDLLAVRAGEFLTPYGIWNVDHGSPTLVGTQAPNVIATEMFPRQQVGIEAYGTRFVGATRLGYHLTVSNGRIGSNPPYENRNGRAGFGARIYAEPELLGSLRVGLSGYTGRYTGYATTTTYAQDPSTGVITAASTTSLSTQYDERDLGMDVSWQWKHLAINAEFLLQRQDFTDASPAGTGIGPGGPVPPGGPGGPLPAGGLGGTTDHTSAGGYIIASYGLPWYGITPWLLWDSYRQDTRQKLTAHNLAPGVDVRLRPDFVVKVQLNHIYSDNAAGSMKPSNSLAAQIAYAF
jgi:hypothetical protein